MVKQIDEYCSFMHIRSRNEGIRQLIITALAAWLPAMRSDSPLRKGFDRHPRFSSLNILKSDALKAAVRERIDKKFDEMIDDLDKMLTPEDWRAIINETARLEAKEASGEETPDPDEPKD